jgi:two-component system sensor histidine kinase SenX3
MVWAITAALGVAVVAALAVLAIMARNRAPQLQRITSAIRRSGEGELATEVPEDGTEEVADEERATREAILSSLEEGIVLFASDGSVLYENGQVRRLIGGPAQSAQRLAPSRLRKLVAAAAEAPSPEVVDRPPATAEVVAGPAGRTIRATATSIPGNRVLLVLRDVTQARLIDVVRRDFVANASHELKTPAASLRALAETIRDAAAEDPQAIRRFAEQLEKEAVRLSRIISDLLDLSRLEGAAHEEDDVRLDRVVIDESERHRQDAEAARLSLDVRGEGPVMVRGSAEELALMTRNLVQNAIQYTRGGGAVDVMVGVEDGQAVITVRDTGTGIPARDRERIFERFYRVDRARSRETGGTGLGLAIVKHVVENHGGTVSVESELGIGSTFVVRLPLRSPP